MNRNTITNTRVVRIGGAMIHKFNNLKERDRILLIINGTVIIVSCAVVGLLTASMVARLIESGFTTALPLSPIAPFIP